METVIDFRNFEPRARHALFLSLFEGLKEGTSFQFVNDHDPVPLYRQVQSMNLPNLKWNYALKGPSFGKLKFPSPEVRQKARDAAESAEEAGTKSSVSIPRKKSWDRMSQEDLRANIQRDNLSRCFFIFLSF